MKIAINTCFGGFGLSQKAIDLYNQLSGKEADSHYDIKRADPFLIQVIEQLGKEANGRHANLRIVEIPEDVKWHIAEYDGSEHVAENHRTWS